MNIDNYACVESENGSWEIFKGSDQEGKELRLVYFEYDENDVETTKEIHITKKEFEDLVRLMNRFKL